MINGKIITVVLPAYNAAKTLEMTYREIPFDIVDEVVLVDDLSKDETVRLAKSMAIKHIIQHNYIAAANLCISAKFVIRFFQ